MEEELEAVRIQQDTYYGYTNFDDGKLKSFMQLVPSSWCKEDGKLDKWCTSHSYTWSYVL